MNPLSPRFVQTKLMSLDDMYDIVESVVLSLPSNARLAADDLEIIVDNFPPADILADLGIDNKYDLLGLYRGLPLQTQPESTDAPNNTIFLYRCPLLRYAEEHQEDMTNLIQHVFVYEMGHHLGIDSYQFLQSLNKKS